MHRGPPGGGTWTGVAVTVAGVLNYNWSDRIGSVDKGKIVEYRVTLKVTFEVGSNQDMDNVLTQNRVSQAMPQMPQSVKNSSGLRKSASGARISVSTGTSGSTALSWRARRAIARATGCSDRSSSAPTRSSRTAPRKPGSSARTWSRNSTIPISTPRSISASGGAACRLRHQSGRPPEAHEAFEMRLHRPADGGHDDVSAAVLEDRRFDVSLRLESWGEVRPAAARFVDVELEPVVLRHADVPFHSGTRRHRSPVRLAWSGPSRRSTLMSAASCMFWATTARTPAGPSENTLVGEEQDLHWFETQLGIVEALGEGVTDRVVGERVARRMGRSLLELGGNNAAVVAILIHALRLLVQGKTWGPRTLAWITGILLAGMMLPGNGERRVPSALPVEGS